MHHHIMDFEIKKSGQIPAFGNWDYANELPITQYFECARQAGLIRHAHPSSLCECHHCAVARGCGRRHDAYANNLYNGDFDQKPSSVRVVAVPHRKTRAVGNCNDNGNNRRAAHVKDHQTTKQVMKKVYDVKEQQQRNQLLTKKKHFPKHSDPIIVHRSVAINVKPVDEDLYKIPPELLHNSKRKKMLRFFSRCLVPPCRA